MFQILAVFTPRARTTSAQMQIKNFPNRTFTSGRRPLAKPTKDKGRTELTQRPHRCANRMSLSEKSAQPAIAGPEFARSHAANLPGEWHAILRQIGSPEFSEFTAGSLDALPAQDFLQNYLSQLLLPVELPAIAEACGHAMRGELREMIDQDHRLTELIGAFASPSRRIGRLQLARLRPLRDDRLVQRYLAAVEFGQANGWHTVVYGLTLALYSLPLRQGLLHYAQETLVTLAKNAAPGNDDAGLDALMEQVPNAVESALARC
jgi:hypothetical protein